MSREQKKQNNKTALHPKKTVDSVIFFEYTYHEKMSAEFAVRTR